MNNTGKDLYEFGPFRLDPSHRLLLRDDHPVPLHPKAFETLLVLVRNSEKVVLKDELLNAVWADAFVEESNLAQNIFVLRKALGDVDGGRRYIMTVPGRGYRFAETVRVVPHLELNVTVTGLPKVVDPERTHEILNGLPQGLPPVAGAPRRRIASRHFGASAFLVVAVLVLAAGVVFYRRFPRIPRLLSVTQVTRSGRVDPWGRIFSDGSRLFLVERDGDHWNTMQVATQGGDTQPFLSTFHNTRIFGISARDSEMLIGPFVGRTGNLPLWSLPLVGGSPRRLGDIAVDDAGFSPDGTKIAFSRGDGIYISDAMGSAPQKLAACAGFCQSLAWSPDGQVIRFTQIEENTDQRTLWEVNVRDGSLHHFLPGWNNPAIDCCGRWTSDGKYYIFASVQNNQSEIWALREFKTPWELSAPPPIQLTHGPFGFGEPLPSRDGHTIYVAGVTERMDLERVDAITHQVKPLLNGMPVWEMYFSRDGQWLVYINSADDSVWRSRADGSAPQKLVQNTNVLRFAHVRFSPDGKRILLQAGGRGQPSRIYTMSADGGAVSELGAIGHPWILPDFSPDGESMVIGSDLVTADKTPERSELYLFNLKSGEKNVVPGSQGLFGAVWSPDGRYLAAYSTDKRVMKIYDFARGRWSELARGNNLTNPSWSADGKYVYLQDLLTPGEPVFRFSTATWRKEPVFSFEEILRSGPQRCLFIGLTPDGSLLTRFTRDGGNLYALGVDLP